MRDTNAGPGMLFVDGQQKQFTLEANWKSPVPPKVGAVVDVELNEAGDVVSVIAVAESQLAKEQANKLKNTTVAQTKKFKDLAVARVGVTTLVSLLVLAVAWLFLNSMAFRISSSFTIDASFYDILKMINMEGNVLTNIGTIKYGSTGVYGLLMWVALLAPIAPHFYSNKYLNLTYMAPLVYLVGVSLSLYSKITSSAATATGGMSYFMNAERAAKMAEQLQAEITKAISIGLGFYLSLTVCIVLAAIGVRRYLVASATEAQAAVQTA